jgi:hypothetical protein
VRRHIVIIASMAVASAMGLLFFGLSGRPHDPASNADAAATGLPRSASRSLRIAPATSGAIGITSTNDAHSTLASATAATTGSAAQELAGETQILIAGPHVEPNQSIKVLSDDASFDKLVASMSAHATIATLEKQQVYANVFQADPLYLSGNVSVDDLQCGKQICIAAVAGQDSQQVDAFIERVTNDEHAPMYLVSNVVPAGAARGRHEKRLLFSTDPALNSFAFHVPQASAQQAPASSKSAF